MLSMPFEVMLTQIPNMPVKFFIVKYETGAEEKEGIHLFDLQLQQIKLPNMVLDKLKMEFDDNY